MFCSTSQPQHFWRAFMYMGLAECSQGRRTFRWSEEAQELVRNYLAMRPTDNHATSHTEFKGLVTGLVALTGNPRDACLRFARQLGLPAKHYRAWTIREQQRLLDLSVLHPPYEVAQILGRSLTSVRARLHRLGASAQMGRDWFTKYTLARVLRIHADEVQGWVDRGWLQCRVIETGKLKKEIIEAGAFAEFCRKYRRAVIGQRLSQDRLDFVQKFVFPPSPIQPVPVNENKDRTTGGTPTGNNCAPVEQPKDDVVVTVKPSPAPLCRVRSAENTNSVVRNEPRGRRLLRTKIKMEEGRTVSNLCRPITR
jgi:hypothetical protein